MKEFEYINEMKPLSYFIYMLDVYRKLANKRNNRLFKTIELLDLYNGNKILDVGCNTGYLPFILNEKGFDIIGIDLFQNQIDIANALKEHLSISSEKLIFKQMDLLKNNFKSESFDYILFLEVVEHVYNPADFLTEFYKLLKPGGHLIISTPNVINFYYILKQMYPKFNKLFKIINEEPRDTGTQMDHIYSWDVFTFYRLLNRIGFKYVDHKFTTLEIPFLFEIPFDIPLLNRFSRGMIFKVQKPI